MQLRSSFVDWARGVIGELDCAHVTSFTCNGVCKCDVPLFEVFVEYMNNVQL